MLIYLFITLDNFFFVQIGISKGLFFQDAATISQLPIIANYDLN